MKYYKSVLFKDLEVEEIDEIVNSSMVRKLNYRENETIFNQEDLPEELFILMDGSVVVEKIDINGKRTIVNVFSESGTMFGEVYMFLDERPYDYACNALEDSQVLAISKEFFDRIYDNDKSYDKKIIKNLLQILSEKAFFLNQKLLIMASFTLKQKIANYLLQKSKETREIELEYKRQELAEYIGTTRPSLSRELMKMEEEGLIKVERDRISILDEASLRELA